MTTSYYNKPCGWTCDLAAEWKASEHKTRSGEDARATGGLVSNVPHPPVNKTKEHTPGVRAFLTAGP